MKIFVGGVMIREINKNCKHYKEIQHRIVWLDKCIKKDDKHIFPSYIYKFGCKDCPDFEPKIEIVQADVTIKPKEDKC